MELRQLKYFLSAARHLSFTEAARECCIVQSAMSQQIRALERELEAPLFERTKHGLKLTSEGKALEQEAALLLKQATQLHTAVAQARTDGARLLRVGCQGSLMHMTLPRALAALRKDQPHVRVWVKSGLRGQLLGALREGALDCALLLQAGAEDGLQSRLILEDPVCAALSADSPLLKAERLTPEALARETLLLCADETDLPPLSARLGAFIRERGPVLIGSQSAAEVLVAAGFGYSLCVQSAARSHPGIAYRALPELPRQRVCLVWPRESPLSAVSEALASLLMMGPSETNGVI